MTIDSEEVAGLVAECWPGAQLTGEPRPLSGGFWASMFRIELTGQPHGVPNTLVLRVAPDRSMGAKELAVQDAVAAQGYRTPRIRAREVGPSGRPWALMDFVDGHPPLDGLDGLAAVRRAPHLVGSLPNEMADALAQLHRIDPGPVTAAVREAAPTVAWRVDDLLGHFEAGARAFDRPELADAVSHLAHRRPTERSPVVCHGDFHPFNLLADDDGSVTVIDWTGSLCAEPAFDLAFTTLLLANPPLDAGGPLGAVVRAAGRVIAWRFLAGYRRANPSADLANLDWYRGLHSARILVEHARLEADTPGAAHPFASMTGVASATLGALLGTDISVGVTR